MLALTLTGSASAATVVTFVALGSNDTLIISNPQAAGVAGQIRLIPDAGKGVPAPVPFTIAAQASQAFPNLLSGFGAIAAPGIVAVESSDVVRLSASSLRIGYAERPLSLPIRFNPGSPASGSLILGILNGLVRVNIYEHQASTAPLISRTFGSSAEQVTRLRYQDVLPATVTIGDGYAEVIPLSGQVVGTAVNPLTRRRAAGSASSVPPILSITGAPACEFATGIRAGIPAVTGAFYRWTLLNATPQGPLTGNALDIALGSRGYASVRLETVSNQSASAVEANIAIEGRPVYLGSNAASVTVGDDTTISWVLAGGTPSGQTLSGTDFASVTLDPTTTSYSYGTTTTGPKTFTLRAENPCGSDGSTGEYSVSDACSIPHIDSFTNSGGACPGSPVQLAWSTLGSGTVSINNGIGGVRCKRNIVRVAFGDEHVHGDKNRHVRLGFGDNHRDRHATSAGDRLHAESRPCSLRKLCLSELHHREPKYDLESPQRPWQWPQPYERHRKRELLRKLRGRSEHGQ